MATFETSDGVEIDYQTRGTGPVLYACQGGPANVSDTLARSLAALEDSFTLVYHDYRGSGRSAPAVAASYTFERLADDLDELRRHLGHGPVPVLAHSMGGFVALNFAVRHPEGCSRLILVGTTPSGRPAQMVVPALRALGPARTAKVAALAAWYLIAWSWRRESKSRQKARYAIMATTQEGLRPVRQKVRDAMAGLPAPNDNAPHLEGEIGRTDLTPQLPHITCPVMILYGIRDAVMVAGSRLLTRGLPRARTVVLPHVGHEPFIESPATAFPPVREFLGAPS